MAKQQNLKHFSTSHETHHHKTFQFNGVIHTLSFNKYLSYICLLLRHFCEPRSRYFLFFHEACWGAFFLSFCMYQLLWISYIWLLIISEDSTMVKESLGSFQLYRDYEIPCETTATRRELLTIHTYRVIVFPAGHIPCHRVPSWTRTYKAEVCS